MASPLSKPLSTAIVSFIGIAIGSTLTTFWRSPFSDMTTSSVLRSETGAPSTSVALTKNWKTWDWAESEMPTAATSAAVSRCSVRVTKQATLEVRLNLQTHEPRRDQPHRLTPRVVRRGPGARRVGRVRRGVRRDGVGVEEVVDVHAGVDPLALEPEVLGDLDVGGRDAIAELLVVQHERHGPRRRREQ